MKNKYLKIGDIVAIAVVIVVIVAIFVISVNRYNIDVDNALVEIVYKNEVIVNTDFKTNATYEIKSSDDLTCVLVYKDNKLIKTINSSVSTSFVNEIVINDSTIHMENASCKNKDCMKTIIDSTHTLPIICTNGVTIRLVENDSIIDEIS